jgi:hypothetical protein
VRDASRAGDDLAWLHEALHALGQPLTALECRLFVGKLEAEGADDRAAVPALRSAVEESLLECKRLFALVRSMQDRAGAMAAEGRGER